jgi:hypothetical protein
MALGLRINEPPAGALVTIGHKLTVAGFVDGTAGAEPVLAESATVQIGQAPAVNATLTLLPAPVPRPPGWFPSWTFRADVQVPGPAGSLSIVVRATFSSNQQITRRVTVTAAAGDLTGYWHGDDNGSYFVKQNGNDLWWVGFDGDFGVQGLGLNVTTVFHGQLLPVVGEGSQAAGERAPVVGGPGIRGTWADVPRGTSLRSGTIVVTPIHAPDGSVQHLQITSSGGFTASRLTSELWQPPQEQDIGSALAAVQKNTSDGETLRDNLTPYKDHVVVFGYIVPQDGYNMLLNYRVADGRTYHDFICLQSGGDYDGDLNINLIVDRDRLDSGSEFSQPGFWTDGWEPGVDPQVIRGKLDNSGGALHLENIMYARNARCSQPELYDSAPALPGWQEMDTNSVLVNGRPANGPGDVQPIAGVDSVPSRVNTFGGKWIGENTYVRVTGPLVLDCGHFDIGDPFDPCHEDDPDSHNQEIHPVCAIDVVDAKPSDDLSGVWGDNLGMSYYVHQVGTIVWWFGTGPMRDHSFAQVFQGTLTGGIIDGSWQDVPYGPGASAGPLRLAIDPGKLILVPVLPGPLSNRRWIKLYDVAGVTARA